MDLPPLEQYALLDLQMAALPSPSSSHPSYNTPASTSHSTAASFLPLLKLLTGSTSHDVCQLAGKLLTRRITDLLGGTCEDEVALWLGLLPKSPDAEHADATWDMLAQVFAFASDLEHHVHCNGACAMPCHICCA